MSNLPVEQAFNAIATPYTVMSNRLAELKARPKDEKGQYTRMTIEMMADLDTDYKRFLIAAADSEPAKLVADAYSVHQRLSRLWHKIIDPAKRDRAWLGATIGDWKTKKDAEAAAERRKREEDARRQQEQQRKDEAAHLASLGHKVEAKELLKAPLPPIALPDAKADEPVKGQSVRMVYKLKEIVQPKLLAEYFVEHPEDLIALMEPKAGEWKRRATSADGMWIVPGVIFSAEPETRNTSR